MSSNYVIEERVIERAMATYPDIPEIVPGSTPVVSFGYPNNARIITVGINPSSSEFQVAGKSKNLLAMGKKRLVDTELLKISNPKSLNREQAVRVIEGCYSYFASNNHYDWFDHLNSSMNSYFKADYYDGSAAHLDLVQWATHPVWGGIESDETKDSLLEADVEFLRYQVNMKKYDAIYLNGASVFEQLTSNRIINASEKDTVIHYKTKSGAPRTLKCYQGESLNGSLVLGCNKPFPGHYIWGEELPRVVYELHQFFDRYTN